MENKYIKIALDAMGGDFGPEVTVAGALEAVKKFDDIEIDLFGNPDEINKYLPKEYSRIKITETTEVIDMGEQNPVSAVRNLRDSSLVVAMRSVKDGSNDALVSPGPTQAIVVGAHLIIKRMPGMHRVALAPIIPSMDGKGKILLDVGANVELRPEHILELAVYASLVAELSLNRTNPTVGLVNIGNEEGKGREVDKETFDLLKQSELINFVGNVEANDIFFTDVDVLVTDGFTGNIVLKSVEGTAKAFGKALKEEIAASFGGKIGYLFMRKNLKKLAKRFDSSEVGGTLIYGINAPVVKAHGSSNATAIYNSIRQARTFIKEDIVNKVAESLKDLPEIEWGV